MKIAQLIGIVCVGALVACGQKGPLVMPDAQKHKRTIPSLPGAPAKPAGGKPTPGPAPTDGSAVSPTPPAAAPASTPSSGSPSSPAATDATSHP